MHLNWQQKTKQDCCHQQVGKSLISVYMNVCWPEKTSKPLVCTLLIVWLTLRILIPFGSRSLMGAFVLLWAANEWSCAPVCFSSVTPGASFRLMSCWFKCEATSPFCVISIYFKPFECAPWSVLWNWICVSVWDCLRCGHSENLKETAQSLS